MLIIVKVTGLFDLYMCSGSSVISILCPKIIVCYSVIDILLYFNYILGKLLGV